MAESVLQDSKAGRLLTALKNGFALMKRCGTNKKAVIFTESVETQKMLFSLLSGKYKALLYNGSADYSAMRRFQTDGKVLISTNSGAKGFNLEGAAFVIHYDLLYNTLKMEQRINRCHRLGQENDVLSLAFIDKNNLANVRKRELINKQILVADGVFGVTDEVVGFTGNLDKAFQVIAGHSCTKAQIEAEHQQTLLHHETENRQLVSTAADLLFTTFTGELADRVKLTPQYISGRTEEINAEPGGIAKRFFENYNATHDNYFMVAIIITTLN